MKNTAGSEVSENVPILGCPSCNTTAGRLGCAVHANPMTPTPSQLPEADLKEFEEIAYPLVHSEILGSQKALKRIEDWLSLKRKEWMSEAYAKGREEERERIKKILEPFRFSERDILLMSGFENKRLARENNSKLDSIFRDLDALSTKKI